MKKAVVVTLAVFFTLTYFSCTKDKTTSCVQTNSTDTYTNTVKVILDAECATAGCHNSTSGTAGIVLDNYTSAANAAKNEAKFFCSIKFECSPSMPQGYSFPIDSASIAALELWRDNCFPE